MEWIRRHRVELGLGVVLVTMWGGAIVLSLAMR